MNAPRTRCPTCRREAEWSSTNAWRPFCSERCRLVDLGAWLTERHAIPGEPATPPDGRPADGEAEGESRR